MKKHLAPFVFLTVFVLYGILLVGCGAPQKFEIYYDEYTFKDGDFIYRSTKDGKASLEGYEGDREIVEIPSSACGNEVYEIRHISNENVKKIIIPSSIKAINNDSLRCYNLESIEVDEENSVFFSENNCVIERKTNVLVKGCNKSIIPSYVESIAPYAFFYNSIKKINIPESVSSIGEHAFGYCNDLEEITVSNDNETFESINSNIIVKKENNTLLFGCANSIIASTIEYISSYAFEGMDKLNSIDISSGVKGIDSYAFYSCENLETVNLPNTIEYIDIMVFGECISLKSINYNGSLDSWQNVEVDTYIDEYWENITINYLD